MVRGWILQSLVAAWLCLLNNINCHEICINSDPPADRSSEVFEICKMYQANGCCDAGKTAAIHKEYTKLVHVNKIGAACASYIEEILCQECSPKSYHLFDDSGRKYAALCADYCKKFRKACSKFIEDVFGDDVCSADKTLEKQHCFPETDLPETHDAVADASEPNEGNEDCEPICIKKLVNGIKNIVGGAFPPDGTDRLFLVQQNGIIWELSESREMEDDPFLDITSKIRQATRTDERGLLSLAFHPKFKTNKLFYIFYNPLNQGKKITSRISEMKVKNMDSPMKADLSSERIILEYSKPQPNHNGGQLFFGKDGFLYITAGDGGGGGDDHGGNGNGQKLDTFLGKILRIDIDGKADGKPYKIPSDNPFATSDDAYPEIFAYGLRNPWRASVDRKTGEIFAGDVGQKLVEEVDIIVNGGNYGWRAYEGEDCYDHAMCQDLNVKDTIEPITTYYHPFGESVIGGYVYRGSAIDALKGKYIFADYKDCNLMVLKKTDVGWKRKQICVQSPDDGCPPGSETSQPNIDVFAFAEDRDGEIYILGASTTSMNSADASVYKIVGKTGHG